MTFFRRGIRGAPWWAKAAFLLFGGWPMLVAIAWGLRYHGDARIFVALIVGLFVTKLWNYYAEHEGLEGRVFQWLKLDDRDLRA